MKNLESQAIGIAPLALIPAYGPHRLRGYNLAALLTSAGCSAYIVDAAGAMSCNIVVIGAYQWRDIFQAQALCFALRKAGKAVVFDFADDLRVFVSKPEMLPAFDDCFNSLLHSASVITVSSLGLKEKFSKIAPCPLIQIDDIGDMLLKERVVKPRKLKDGMPLTIGWNGCSWNFDTLLPIQNELAEAIAKAKQPVQVCALSPEPPKLSTQPKFKYVWRQWRFDCEASNDLSFSQFDIGLAPVLPGALKSSNRSVSLALSGALPIATDTLDNREALGEAAPELLCKTSSDWAKILKKSLGNPAWRIEKTLALQESIMRRMNRGKIAERWLETLELALKEKKRRAIAVSSKTQAAIMDREPKAMLFRDKWMSLSCRFKTVCLYGAGKHSKLILSLIKGLKGPKLLAVLDDKAKEKSKLGRIPLLPTKCALALNPSCIVLGTDTFQAEMTESLRKQGLGEIPAIDLYKSFPPQFYKGK